MVSLFGTDYQSQRRKLVRSLIDRRYLNRPEVIRAMETVERHLFLPEPARGQAYWDQPLDIGHGQTISAPHMVAIMAEALDLRPGQRVLEVGGGSGYHAAVAAEVVGGKGHIYTVERVPALAEFARDNLARAGYGERCTVVVGDGSLGLPEHAPYDRIFVACAAPDIPQPLKEQLKDGGKVLVPVGKGYQDLMLGEKRAGGFRVSNLGGCVFVPLLGEHGFR